MIAGRTHAQRQSMRNVMSSSEWWTPESYCGYCYTFSYLVEETRERKGEKENDRAIQRKKAQKTKDDRN